MNSVTQAETPSTVNAIHHVEMLCSTTSAPKVPPPNFARTEKILPKNIEDTGFIKPDIIVPLPENTMETQCALVVNVNKDLHEGEDLAASALARGCNS
jgi:hypothetical protein